MSREERRNYERMMKSMDRGPALPPAAKARAERNAQRRAARATAPVVAFTPRFIVTSALIAVAAGFLAFSLQWPNMPFALLLGILVTAIVLAVQVGFRLLRRRASAR